MEHTISFREDPFSRHAIALIKECVKSAFPGLVLTDDEAFEAFSLALARPDEREAIAWSADVAAGFHMVKARKSPEVLAPEPVRRTESAGRSMVPSNPGLHGNMGPSEPRFPSTDSPGAVKHGYDGIRDKMVVKRNIWQSFSRKQKQRFRAAIREMLDRHPGMRAALARSFRGVNDAALAKVVKDHKGSSERTETHDDVKVRMLVTIAELQEMRECNDMQYVAAVSKGEITKSLTDIVKAKLK